MIELSLSLATLMTLGVYVFFVYRWWYTCLLNLKAKHELAEAHKLAVRRQYIFILLMGIPIVSSLAFILNLKAFHPSVAAILLVAAIIPGFIWWLKHVRILKEKGMYPPNNSFQG